MCAVFQHDTSGKNTFLYDSGKLFQFDSARVVQWKIISLSLAKKMQLSTLKRCLSSRKSFVNSSRHLKFLQVTSHGSHTRSFFTLAPRRRNHHAGHRNYEKKIEPMQIIFQS